MKKFSMTIPVILMVLLLLTGSSCTNKQPADDGSQAGSTDLVQARRTIEALGDQFTEEIRNLDSLALAGHYATDGSLGSVKGKENLIAAWGRMARSAHANGTPSVLFTTTSLCGDGEYLAELGVYEYVDTNNTVKSTGKYLVVWKQENGAWKIYRDIGL